MFLIVESTKILFYLLSGRNYWEHLSVIVLLTHLLGKEYSKGATFMYNGSSWLFTRLPFEQKYETMNRPGNEIKIHIRSEYEYSYKIVQLNPAISNLQGKQKIVQNS